MSVRIPDANDEFRVVTDSSVVEERAPSILKFVLRFQKTLNTFEATSAVFGVRDYPGPSSRDIRYLSPWDARAND